MFVSPPAPQQQGEQPPPSTSSQILFMFLGGLPLESKHWIKFFEDANKDQYKIVVHPIKLEGYHTKITESNFKQFEENILVVDKDHHVRTRWWSRSLSDATLLMMQYSLLEKGNIFKKLILVDSTNMPIYNFDVIYKTLTENNKTWMFFSNKNYPDDHMLKTYTWHGGQFDIDDMNFSSQWFTLDQQHLKFYFDLDNLNKENYTYKQAAKDTGCNTDYIISDNPRLQGYLNSFGNYNISFNGGKEYCTGSDEIYFQSVLRKNIKHESIENHIYLRNITELETVSENIYITLDNYDLIAINGIMKNKSAWANNINNIWYGSHIEFNSKKADRVLMWEDDNGKLKMFNTHGEKKDITKEQKDDLCNERITIEELLDQGGGSGQIYYSNNKNRCFVGESLNYLELKNKYSVSSTYTDWQWINLSPSNIFRGLDLSLFYKNEPIPSYNLSNLLVGPPSEIINMRDIDDTIGIEAFETQYYAEGQPSNPGYHPLEYERISLVEIVNALNLILKLRLRVIDNNYLYNAYQYWMKTVLSKNVEWTRLFDEVGYLHIADNEENREKKYGFDINTTVLNNALKYGALFIRKVKNTSFIDKHSEQIFSLNEYVPEMTTFERGTTHYNSWQFTEAKDTSIDDFLEKIGTLEGMNKITITINRKNIFNSLYLQFIGENERFENQMFVKFTEGFGIDAGGLTKQLFNDLPGQITGKGNEEDKFFLENDSYQLLNPANNNLEQYKFLGKFFAYAIKLKQNINISLHPVILYMLKNSEYSEHNFNISNTLGKKIMELYTEQIPLIDLELIHKNIQTELKYSDRITPRFNTWQEIKDEIDKFDCTIFTNQPFTRFMQLNDIPDDFFWTQKKDEVKICLREAGFNCIMFEDPMLEFPFNKKDLLINILVKGYLINNCRDQLEHFVRGFHELIPPNELNDLSLKNLNLLIRGKTKIDIEDFLNNLEINYADRYIDQIHAIIRTNAAADSNYLNIFIAAATGHQNLPYDGFANKRFNTNKLTLEFIGYKNNAHTCFNKIDIPTSALNDLTTPMGLKYYLSVAVIRDLANIKVYLDGGSNNMKIYTIKYFNNI